MIKSMTGFGKAEGEIGSKAFSIDIKALNGKTTDLRMKIPTYIKSKEVKLRNQILDQLKRGKIDCTIVMTYGESEIGYNLNMGLIEKYYQQLAAFGRKNKLDHQDFLQTIIRIPNVIEALEEDISEDDWQFIQFLMEKAVNELDAFRMHEGLAMHEDMAKRVRNIDRLLEEIPPHEEKRLSDMREKLHGLIESHLTLENVDENRLEQEVVYYIEKMDIHEEKIRLEQHCKFFMEVMESDEGSVGKKLSFISQEMGREINTIGAKAQYSPIQQIVVEMKVELDQIREQLANVL